MVFLCIACIVLSSIALHGIAWHCMVLQRLHGVVQIIWRAGELPRSASSHFYSHCEGGLFWVITAQHGSTSSTRMVWVSGEWQISHQIALSSMKEMVGPFCIATLSFSLQICYMDALSQNLA